MTKHNKKPRGLRKVSKKVWNLDGDRGKSAYAFVKEPKVKIGNTINFNTANQMGSMQYKVVGDKRGRKSLKVTYDPNSPGYGSSGGKRRNTRKNRK